MLVVGASEERHVACIDHIRERYVQITHIKLYKPFAVFGFVESLLPGMVCCVTHRSKGPIGRYMLSALPKQEVCRDKD